MKLKNLKLVGILAALVAIYFLVDFTGSKGKSKSTKSELVDLDVDAVTQVNVSVKGNEVSLDKKSGLWKVRLENGEWVPATESSVNSAIEALAAIKPSRLVSKKEEKWKDYQVDSTGTWVKVYQGDDMKLDIVLGRFAMEGQRSYSTFVRLADEQEVYNVKNFMSYTISSEVNSYRDKTLAEINEDSLVRVQFSYPSDSGFVLVKEDQIWTMNGGITDSTAVDQYLNSLSNLNSSKFYDEEFSREGPKSTIIFNFSSGKSIKIDAFWVDEHWVIQSSENLDAWYIDDKLFEKIFKSTSDFAIK